MLFAGSSLDSFSDDVIWTYVTSRNMTAVVVAWIDRSFNGAESPPKVHKWPVSAFPTLDASYVNKLNMCTSHTKVELLKAFARYILYTTYLE